MAPGLGLRHEVPREDFRAAVEGIPKSAAAIVKSLENVFPVHIPDLQSLKQI